MSGGRSLNRFFNVLSFVFSQQYFPESSLQLENGQQNLTEGNPSRMSFSESGAVGKVASKSPSLETLKP